MFKQEKGITLIALVITIIVLLILAGITIALIAGQDSAPKKAVEGRAMNAIGAGKDAVTVLATTNISTYYEEKYVDKPENAKYASVQAAVLAAASATAPECTIAIAAEGSDSIKVTYSGDTRYYSVGQVSADGTIKWTDTKPASN